MIENLNFHAFVGGIAFVRGTDADAVVRSFGEQEFETENEIRIFFLREEIAAAVFRADDMAAPYDIACAFAAFDGTGIYCC